MKAADLGRARSIVEAIAKLDAEETAMQAGVNNAGIRFSNNAGAWVNLPVGMHPQLVALLQAHHVTERARLGRLAAQIGLAL